MNSKIVFSKHARYQMKERNISEDEVIVVIINPDEIISQVQQKFQAVKSIKRNDKEYLIIVIFRQVNSSKKIITVFLTSKIKKYYP